MGSVGSMSSNQPTGRGRNPATQFDGQSGLRLPAYQKPSERQCRRLGHGRSRWHRDGHLWRRLQSRCPARRRNHIAPFSPCAPGSNAQDGSNCCRPDPNRPDQPNCGWGWQNALFWPTFVGVGVLWGSRYRATAGRSTPQVPELATPGRRLIRSSRRIAPIYALLYRLFTRGRGSFVISNPCKPAPFVCARRRSKGAKSWAAADRSWPSAGLVDAQAFAIVACQVSASPFSG